jgi:hypothetical protein
MATAWGNLPGINRGQDIAISGLTAAGTYMTVGVAVDLDSNTFRCIVGDDTSWSAPQSISGITGAKFPIWATVANGDACIADFAGTAWEHALLSGYSVWDASCTWNPSDKNASITLSGGNLTATGGTGSWHGVRGTVSHTTGKWQFEIKIKLNTGNGNQMVGVGNASAVLNNYPNVNTNAACIQSNGNFGQNNSFAAISRVFDEFSNDWRTVLSDTYHRTGRYYVEVLCNAVSSLGTGLIIGVANGNVNLAGYLGLDAAGNSAGFQSNRAYLKNNGFTSNVLPSALTATHVIGLDINLDAGTIAANIDGGAYSAAQSIASIIGGSFGGIGTTPIFFAVSFLDAPSTYDSVTVNFGATAFTYTAPGSAVSWDTSPGTLETRFAEVSRSALIDGSSAAADGALKISYAGREALHTWDSPLNISGIYRSALVSNTSTGAATALFVGTVFRTALVADLTTGNVGQTAVTVMA